MKALKGGEKNPWGQCGNGSWLSLSRDSFGRTTTSGILGFVLIRDISSTINFSPNIEE